MQKVTAQELSQASPSTKKAAPIQFSKLDRVFFSEKFSEWVDKFNKERGEELFITDEYEEDGAMNFSVTWQPDRVMNSVEVAFMKKFTAWLKERLRGFEVEEVVWSDYKHQGILVSFPWDY